MSYSIQDKTLDISRALPAQNTTAYTSSIDLMSATQELVGNVTDLYVSVPATTCATGQTITLTVQDSADDSTFASVNTLLPLTLTGVSNATSLTTRTFRLPPNIRRYARVAIAMSATTGDQTAITATIRLQF